MNTRPERLESAVQIGILLLIGSMAGAASFTHVHDWTMANTPAGTGDWFGWANAVISELTPTAAGLEIRRRKRSGGSITYPMAVLIAAAVLSVGAQVAQAKPGPTGYLLAALPALAFLALSKLVLSRTPTTAEPEHPVSPVHLTVERPALEADHPAPMEPVSEQLLNGARMAAFSHHNTTGQPITALALAEHLAIPADLAATVLAQLDGTHNGNRP